MTIKIKTKPYKKIKEFIKQMGAKEIGGLLCGVIKPNGDIIIKDAMVLKQEVSGGRFEIDEEDMMDLTKNADAKLLASIVGWWHSHGNGFLFWSEVDDRCFERLCDLCGLCFGIVGVNRPFSRKKKVIMKCRLDIEDKNGDYISIDKIRAEVGNKPFVKVSKRKISEEIEEKVNSEVFQYAP